MVLVTILTIVLLIILALAIVSVFVIAYTEERERSVRNVGFGNDNLFDGLGDERFDGVGVGDNDSFGKEEQ